MERKKPSTRMELSMFFPNYPCKQLRRTKPMEPMETCVENVYDDVGLLNDVPNATTPLPRSAIILPNSDRPAGQTLKLSPRVHQKCMYVYIHTYTHICTYQPRYIVRDFRRAPAIAPVGAPDEDGGPNFCDLPRPEDGAKSFSVARHMTDPSQGVIE